MRKTPIFEKAVSNRERKIVPILGILVDSASKERALNRAWKFGYGGDKGNGGNKGKRTRLVVTPNPEIIIASLKDKSLARILNSADLAVPDGIGVVMAMRYLGMRERGGVLRPLILVLQEIWVGLSLFINRKWLFEASEVVPGRWLFEEVVKLAVKEGKRVFLLGGKPGIAEKATSTLNAKWPMLNAKYNSGPWLDEEGKPKSKIEIDLPAQAGKEKEAIKQINAFKPDFLFVGFGHPKQEKWLGRNLPKLNVGAAMTVGGAFDYLASAVPEPPQWLTQAGLEWLWRLLTQPRRARRIFTALIIFPLTLYFYRLRNKETHI